MKRFLSDLLENTFRKWGRKKIFINAPTGLGKTTFVVKTLLPYLETCQIPLYERKKLLILCNRKLLREQYWYSLISEFDRYKEFRESVEIKTYQQLAEEIKNCNTEQMFCKYLMIICDECHYFYADADFNGFGTFVVLQAIVYFGIGLPVVFMTATMKEVEPLIEETIEKCKFAIRRGGKILNNANFEVLKYDYSHLEDFSNFVCIAVPDEDTLCAEIGNAGGKSIIFIDDRVAAERMSERIQAAGNLGKNDIAILNAENLDNDGNSEVIKALVMSHLCLPKVIITTSVLDNGVSIEDSEVQNVVIITESRISFMQMLGRVRVGYAEKVKLFFLLRQAEFFARREEKYRLVVDEIDKISRMNCNMKRFPVIDIAWGEDRMAKIYRKILTPCPDKLAYFRYGDREVRICFGDTYLALNDFAREKIGDTYLCEGKMHMLAMRNPIEVVWEQMSWLGKDKSELMEINSSYRENLIEKLITDLLEIHEFPNNEFVKAKERLACTYRKDLFPDVVKKDGSFETKKLEKILERYGLELITEEKGGKKLYSINMKGEVTNEGNSNVGET